jgi:hypothetical protein
MTRRAAIWLAGRLCGALVALGQAAVGLAADPAALAAAYAPPPELAGELGDYRSPLVFDDGHPVQTAAEWPARRQEILDHWHAELGAWPPLVEKPRLEELGREAREGYSQRHIRLQIAPDRTTDDAYLLVPPGPGPFPAVLVVYYEAKTGIGEGKEPLRDFAAQLARRGFVALSLGSDPNTYYPSREQATLQPLSFHAYVAANACNALAALPGVDPRRIGIVGHSYGGKWALFAACLYERFAAVAVSDPGIVFDEGRPNVNYWDQWYLGYEPGRERPRGGPQDGVPRSGAYRRLVEQGRDLHELHALLAPRPLLVSGGSEDPPERWRALNHLVAVNRLLSAEGRVAMTNRSGHAPTAESNAAIYAFFEQHLK